MRYRLVFEDLSSRITTREEFTAPEQLHARLRDLGIPEVRGYRDGFYRSPARHYRWLAIAEDEDLFTVSGTEFLFPSLPVDEPMRSEEVERRRSIVDAASRVQYRPPRPPRAPRPPRPGNGVFAPSPGEPGAPVTVEVRGTPLEGCILFPAPSPRTFWVSFWDGLTPVEVKIPRGSTVGQVKPSVEDELVRRLRARGSAA